MKEIIKSLKRLRRLEVIHFGLVAVWYMLVIFVLRTYIQSYPRTDIRRILIIMITIVIVFIPVWAKLYRNLIIKRLKKYVVSSQEPWKIECNIYSENELLNLLEKKMELTKISEDCWFGKYGQLRSKQWRFFAFAFKHSPDTDVLKTAEEYVYKVNEMTYFTTYDSSNQGKQYGRVQIFIRDTVPQEIIEATGRNAEMNIMLEERVVNLFVSLNEGIIYVPFMFPSIDPELRVLRFLDAITDIENILEL